MRLSASLAVTTGVALGTDRLHIKVMLGVIPKEMVVFVPSLTLLPNVATIRAWQGIRVGTATSSNLGIDSLASLLTVAINCRFRARSRAAGQWIDSERHRLNSVEG